MENEKLNITKHDSELLNSIDSVFPKDGIAISCNPLRKYEYIKINYYESLKDDEKA
jgi:hypothetical protein